jgi:NAD(P)H-hydrate repair Nnr-like enzyme with NAD(P)H-hydrate epimerase domain
MAAVTAAQMREIETRAISAGFSEAELMEQAGQALGIALGCQFP